MHFCATIFFYIYSNLNEIWPYMSNCQCGNIGSGNGLVPNRQQAITRTSDAILDISGWNIGPWLHVRNDDKETIL